MTVAESLYPSGAKIRFLRVGMPVIGRIVEDDPVNGRAKVRIETPHGAMHAVALTTIWVPYEHITERIR